MIEEAAKSGIQLTSIRLLNSVFTRKNIEDSPIDLRMSIDFGHALDEESNEISIEVAVRVLSEANPDFEIFVSMIGSFKQHSKISFPVEEFCNINGPAMIYPYVRQHIRALSLEAKIKTVLLPVVNFINLNKERNSD